MSTIAVIVGSLRKGSFNRQVAQALPKLPAAQGHDFTFPEIGGLPLYDQDQDTDQPEPVKQFKAAIQAADGVLFVTPEYNRSIPGVLKNAIDHASRPHGKSAWQGIPAGVIGVSPGKTGTALAQQHLRNVLVSLDMPMLHQPEMFIQWNDTLVTAAGEIGEASNSFLNGWMDAFLRWVKLHADCRK